MTIKEAVNWINKHHATLDKGIRADDAESMTLAINALKKQMPAKVNNRIKYHFDCDGGKCPNCSSEINQQMEYCVHCGQRIDWEENGPEWVGVIRCGDCLNSEKTEEKWKRLCTLTGKLVEYSESCGSAKAPIIYTEEE